MLYQYVKKCEHLSFVVKNTLYTVDTILPLPCEGREAVFGRF